MNLAPASGALWLALCEPRPRLRRYRTRLALSLLRVQLGLKY